MKRLVLAALSAFFIASPAFAAAINVKAPRIDIPASASSQRVQLPANYTIGFAVSADTTGTCYITTGNSSVVADSSTSFPILAGTVQTFSKNTNDTYIAAVCPSGTGTLYINVDNGD